MRFVAIWMLLLAGCSEYEWHNPTDPAEGPYGSTGTSSQPGTQPGQPGDATGDLTTEEPPEDRIPPEFETDCLDDGGIWATWLSGEIYRLSWEGGPAVGQLEAPESGQYHVYDVAVAESGDAQWNESAYLRIPNQGNPIGIPQYGNCGAEWVMVDSDNYAPVPAGSLQYLGTFWLDEGVNDVELWHFCELYRDTGVCPDLHFTDVPDSTCDSSNPNSVHLTGEALCLLPL